MITLECREEAFLLRPWTRQSDIVDLMKDRKMTAREICFELGFVDPNTVRPRLTELVQSGYVEVVGKVKDGLTGRTVSVYRRKTND